VFQTYNENKNLVPLKMNFTLTKFNIWPRVWFSVYWAELNRIYVHTIMCIQLCAYKTAHLASCSFVVFRRTQLLKCICSTQCWWWFEKSKHTLNQGVGKLFRTADRFQPGIILRSN